MNTEHSKISVRIRFIAAGTSIAFFAGCATTPQTASHLQYGPAASILREARSSEVPVEKRAADYLQVAGMTAPLLGTGAQETPACDTYNAACGELTVLLRSSEGGRLWNHPLTLTASNQTYHLRLQPAGYAVWAPDYFASFKLADSLNAKRVKTPNLVDGVGGELVGVRSPTPLDAFTPPLGGITAPSQPHSISTEGTQRWRSGVRPSNPRQWLRESSLAGGQLFRASPLLQAGGERNDHGADGGAHGQQVTLSKTGLYFLEPYDPDRIPLIFVHGLISTPQMWLNVINDLQQDPVLRERYQVWIFAYPTGLPVLYSSLRFRDALAEVQKLYPNHKDYVLVSHSMGGLLSQLQATTMSRADWEKTMGEPAKNLFAKLNPDDLVSKAVTFKANRHIKRIVFICTPHGGHQWR